MPAKKRRSASKDRAAGGGRTPVTEPRVQTFALFGGCHFQMAPHDFDTMLNTDLEDQDGSQTDLMAIYMAIQNNARLAPNKTIETRPNLRTLFTAPSGLAFTGVATLIGSELYAACGAGLEPPSELVSHKAGATAVELDTMSDRWQTFPLSAGQRITGIVLKGNRGAVISGGVEIVVTDAEGLELGSGGASLSRGEAAEVEIPLDLPFIAPATAVYRFGVRASVSGYFVVMKSTDSSYPDGALDGVGTDDLYFAVLGQDYSPSSIHYGELPLEGAVGDMTDVVTTTDNDGTTSQDNTWTFLGHADDKLVGLTAGKQLWTGPLGAYTLENARPVPDPPAIAFAQLAAHGLAISETATATCPFRIGLTYTRLNKYGPTKAPAVFEFYASRPTSEWSAGHYVTVSGTVPNGYDITAVELYYTEGESQEPAFLTRVKLLPDPPAGDTKDWTYNWTGYLFDTSMWTTANLKVPDANYTAGVPASSMAALDGQLYFWGGEPAHRVWIGGNPGNRFSVSTGTGGGFVDCEPGTGVQVRKVLKFKTQQGASIVTMLCDSENSQKEARFNLVENNISISNEQSVKGWQAEKIAGTVGCKSAHGGLVAGDGLYAISRYGLAITTLTMEYNSQLQVQYVSDPIEPVFLGLLGNQLSLATLFAVNDVLYMTFGGSDGSLDNVVFCYDIGLKAWWTITLDVDEPILNMVHIDHEDHQEGIGIITANAIYLLPTTREAGRDTLPLHEVLIESAELCPVQPMQGMQHLTQLEFRFDHFIGDLIIDVMMVDQFGRRIHVEKHVSHAALQHKLAEYMRIDKVVSSYRVALRGRANMRLTHFMAKTYPKSNRIGSVWGFDSRQSGTSPGSIQRTFATYNDVRAAIIP